MERDKDLRVIKTKNNIRSTFIQLLHEKDFVSITVQDILDRALLNRTTFYKHYSSKYELAESMSQSILDKFNSSLNVSINSVADFRNLLNNMDKIYEFLYQDKVTILGLWKIQTEEINLYQDMQSVLKQIFISFAKDYADKESNIEYQSRVFVAITLASFRYVLESEKRHSAYEINAEMHKYLKLVLNFLPRW